MSELSEGMSCIGESYTLISLFVSLSRRSDGAESFFLSNIKNIKLQNTSNHSK